MKRGIVNNDSPLTVNEGLTNPIPKPETSQTSPSETQLMPEPTTTKVLEDVAQIIAPELKPKNESDQVCEPATTPVTVGILMEYKGKEEGPTHIPVAEGELQLAYVDLRYLFDPLFSSAPPSLVSLTSLVVSPSHEYIEFLLVPSSPKSSGSVQPWV